MMTVPDAVELATQVQAQSSSVLFPVTVMFVLASHAGSHVPPPPWMSPLLVCVVERSYTHPATLSPVNVPLVSASHASAAQVPPAAQVQTSLSGLSVESVSQVVSSMVVATRVSQRLCVVTAVQVPRIWMSPEAVLSVTHE